MIHTIVRLIARTVVRDRPAAGGKHRGRRGELPDIVRSPRAVERWEIRASDVTAGRQRRLARVEGAPPPETWQPQPRVQGAYYPPISWERPPAPEGEESHVVRPYMSALGNQEGAQ